MKKNRIVSLVVMITLVIAMVPSNVHGANKKKASQDKTYVFFGSDSRAKDEQWRSPSGGRITKDVSGTQGVPRSDVIMLLKVNKKKKTIDVISIYRDTLLDVSGKGTEFQKANRAYSDLGPKKAVKALEKNLDIKISGYVATNFKGVANVIDAMGGVDIKIEKDKVDPANRKKGRKNVPDVMNEYIDEMNRLYSSNTAHVKKTGKQTLTGLQAVGYARVRYTTGADMRRSVRQRAVLSAMSKKFRASSAKTKAATLLAVSKNVETDINMVTFTKLLAKYSKYKISKKQGFPYYKKGCVIKTKKEKGGLSEVIVPCDLNNNVSKLHKSFYKQKKYKLSKRVKKYSKKISKKTKLRFNNRARVLDNKY